MTNPGQKLPVARGPFWVWAVVTLAILGAMAAVRILSYPNTIIPLSYVVPLLLYLYNRQMGLMWALAGSFVGLVVTKIILIPADAMNPFDRVFFGAMQIASILISAGVIHRVDTLSRQLHGTITRLEETNSELETSNEELAAREEEITQQNEELQSQAEELEQQMEELNSQAEELTALNEHLAARERTVNELLESPAAVAGEDEVLRSVGSTIPRLLGTRVAAAALLEPTGGSVSVRALIASDAISPPAPRQPTLASAVISRGVAGFIADLSERPDLAIPGVPNVGAVRSLMAAPVRAGETVTGAVEFYSTEPGPWSEVELRIAQWLADQLGRLLHNARLRADLDRQRELLRTVADNSRGALVVASPDGLVNYLNPVAQRLTRRRLDDGRPLHVHELFHDDSHSREDCPLVTADGDARAFEDLVCNADGQYVPVRSAVIPVMEDGRVAAMVYEVHDVSDQHRMNSEREQLLDSERAARAELERANRAKDEFVATLSHELRTPLNAILGWSTLLARSRGSDEAERAKGLEIIDRNARHQAQLISDLLDISRITAGKIRIEFRPVALAEIIEAALASVRPAADAKILRIETSLGPVDREVRGDPDRLQQILWNLLTNAIKFTPKGGTVRVGLSRVGASVQIRVADTGAGIDSVLLTNLFERYRQGDASTTRSHAGLGLGLAIAKHLVELHGGTISASSDGPGRGAAFSVLLPSQPALPASRIQPAASHDGEKQEEPLPSLDNLRVLAVDDDADARDLVQRILQERGAEVTTAETVSQAMEILTGQRIDLLVSDIGLPGTDGYALIRKLRTETDERTRTIPAIALTAFARSEDRTRALLAGFDAHAAKPVEPSDLVATAVSLTAGTRRDAEERSQSSGQPR